MSEPDINLNTFADGFTIVSKKKRLPWAVLPDLIEMLKLEQQYREMNAQKLPGGCPCGEDCCTDPHPYGGHDEFCECDDDSCDYHWVVGCLNCGETCKGRGVNGSENVEEP